MADQDMQLELEQLRAEVAALSAARTRKKAAEAQTEASVDDTQAAQSDEVSGIIGQAQAAVEADAELKGQFDQLFEHLEQEIKDLPAITTLAVFSLGVLFGRLLR
jgi:hypothetical protein